VGGTGPSVSADHATRLAKTLRRWPRRPVSRVVTEDSDCRKTDALPRGVIKLVTSRSRVQLVAGAPPLKSRQIRCPLSVPMRPSGSVPKGRGPVRLLSTDTCVAGCLTVAVQIEWRLCPVRRSGRPSAGRRSGHGAGTPSIPIDAPLRESSPGGLYGRHTSGHRHWLAWTVTAGVPLLGQFDEGSPTARPGLA
jgi:hypothetical protein